MTKSFKGRHQAGLNGRLKELLKDIDHFVHHASEGQKEELLSLLEDLRQGDRRRHTRKPCSTAVTYATLDRVFKGFLTNISTGGVFVETGEPLVPGQEITLTFSFPNQERPMKLTGQIVWSVEDRGMGVKFTTASYDLQVTVKSL
jgi:uncharacterized protein (TIGR02266 family)